MGCRPILGRPSPGWFEGNGPVVSPWNVVYPFVRFVSLSIQGGETSKRSTHRSMGWEESSTTTTLPSFLVPSRGSIARPQHEMAWQRCRKATSLVPRLLDIAKGNETKQAWSQATALALQTRKKHAFAERKNERSLLPRHVRGKTSAKTQRTRSTRKRVDSRKRICRQMKKSCSVRGSRRWTGSDAVAICRRKIANGGNEFRVSQLPSLPHRRSRSCHRREFKG